MSKRITSHAPVLEKKLRKDGWTCDRALAFYAEVLKKKSKGDSKTVEDPEEQEERDAGGDKQDE
jgi:hypothetical protein